MGIWIRGTTLNTNKGCTTKGQGQIRRRVSRRVTWTIANYGITCQESECEVVELQEQLEQLNVKVKSLEHGNELASQQEALSSYSSKIGTTPTKTNRNQVKIGTTMCNAKRHGNPISRLENHLHFGYI